MNGRQTSKIRKGVFDSGGGRFSIPADGFKLFVSQDPTRMTGTAVRCIRFNSGWVSDEQLRSQQLSSVYSQWLEEVAREDADLTARLSLSELYKRPPPVWQDAAYIAEFGDASVEGTAGSVFGALRVFSAVMARAWSEQREQMALPSVATGAVERGLQVLAESIHLAKQYELAQKNPNQLIAFVRKFRDRLEALPVGEAVLVPAKFSLAPASPSTAPFILALERSSVDDFTVTVINPGLGSTDYHAASPTSAPPKIQSRLTLSLKGVVREKLLDDAWWFVAFPPISLPPSC